MVRHATFHKLIGGYIIMQWFKLWNRCIYVCLVVISLLECSCRK